MNAELNKLKNDIKDKSINIDKAISKLRNIFIQISVKKSNSPISVTKISLKEN